MQVVWQPIKNYLTKIKNYIKLSRYFGVNDFTILRNLNISFLGKKKIYNKKTEAFHYKLLGNESNGGDVDIDIWYENDEWIKMVFKKDGSKIEYFLDEYHGE